MGEDGGKAGREVTGKTLYRAMTADANGEPACGSTARTLGVRSEVDIAVDADGQVHPDMGGMSVAPDSPLHLPRHRRPPEFGGTGKDPVWRIQEVHLGPMLRYNPDRGPHPQHGVIEPAISMTFEAYQRALQETVLYWIRISS